MENSIFGANVDKLLILLTRLFKTFSAVKAAGSMPSLPEPAPIKKPLPASAAMKLGQKGLDLIKEFEGLKLESYQDEADIWTIGYGHIKGVAANQKITQEQADEFLRADVEQTEKDVNFLVKTKINQNQFDALVAFAFNVGSDVDDDNVAEGLGDSTLLRKLNSDDMAGAADQFLVWNKIRKKGVLTVSNGLSRRRAAERKLFLET